MTSRSSLDLLNQSCSDYVRSSTARHYHLDHLGSPRLVTGPTKQVLARHVYAPYGEELTPPLQDDLRMKFTGHERDRMDVTASAGDLDYMHARYYSGSMGRFMSVDRLLGVPGNSQSWNRFSYARGNPLKFTDPSGLYVVNCSGEECQAASESFEAARQENLTSDDQKVRDAALIYGDPGEDNGITVAFGDTGDANGTTGVYAQVQPDGSWTLSGTVTFDLGVSGTALEASVAHEGQHLVDGAAFVSTFVSLAQAPFVSYDKSKNLTEYQTEVNAYLISHSVYKAAGERFSTGCRGCELGSGLRTTAEVNRAIDKILADPNGLYRVTPKNQGQLQFKDWQ